MPHHKLLPVGRHDSYADEIILSRNEETGEVEHMLSVHDSREIPEELLSVAHDLAGKSGLRVIEADPPEEDEYQREPGADATAQSPVIKQTGESSAEIDQQATGGRAAQQDTGNSGTAGPATTTSGGTPGSSATSAPGAAGTAGASGTPNT